MLEAKGISVSFGGVSAVSGVSLSVDTDELVGLVGPNGSGKTTFLNAVCGAVAASGNLRIDGKSVPLCRPGAAWRAGLSRMFQAPQTFEELCCIENVLLGSSEMGWRGLSGAWIARHYMWRSERRRWARAMEMLELVGLADYATEEASLLTYGQRRLLELARALGSDPKVLLLDEPSAGLNTAETMELGERLVEIRRSGVAVIVVDHKVDFLDAICDRLVVLQLGEVIAEGPPEEVWKHEQVVSAYLGVPGGA